jgi:hypothetical protein
MRSSHGFEVTQPTHRARRRPGRPCLHFGGRPGCWPGRQFLSKSYLAPHPGARRLTPDSPHTRAKPERPCNLSHLSGRMQFVARCGPRGAKERTS